MICPYQKSKKDPIAQQQPTALKKEVQRTPNNTHESHNQ
jgi:hypothetical protein